MEVPGHQPLEYELFLSPKGTGYGISKEILCQKREGYAHPFNTLIRPVTIFDITKLGRIGLSALSGAQPLRDLPSQVPKMFREPEEMRRILANATEYHALDVGPRAPVKLPQQMKPATTPGASGGSGRTLTTYVRVTAIVSMQYSMPFTQPSLISIR